MSYVRRWSSRPTQPCHDIAGPCIDADGADAEVCCKASFGRGDVAVHSGPIEEQPATRKMAGVGAVDTDKACHPALDGLACIWPCT